MHGAGEAAPGCGNQCGRPRLALASRLHWAEEATKERTVSRASLWSVPFLAALVLGGACAVGEKPDAGGESTGNADRPGDREPPGQEDEVGGDVDGGAGDDGDGTTDPDGGAEADPGDDGQGDDGGDDGGSIVCPVCDDAFALCTAAATTTQALLACEWQWVRCALPACDLGDARQCFIALDSCFQLCQTLSDCVACSLAGQECYY
jgi:hypothetical protein